MKLQVLKKTLLLFTFIGLFCTQMNAQIYDFDADLEGWDNGYGGANSGTVFYDISGGETDGALVLQRASNNSNFGLDPANIDADNIDYVRIKFKNLSNATSFRIQAPSGSIGPEVYNITANNNVWVTMDLLLSGVNGWTGTVTNIDILVRGGYNATEGNMIIDEIEFYNSTAPCTTPDDVTSFTVTDNGGGAQLDLAWTNGSCFDEILVVAKATSAVNETPVNGATYAGDAIFGNGIELGTSTGEYAVYNGTGTSVSVTGLTNNTVYHFSVFTRRGTTWTALGVTGNGTPTAPILPTFVDYAGAEEADGTTTGVIEPNTNGNNSVTGWFFQDLDFSFSADQQATGDYSIKFDSDDAATATPYNAFLGSPSAAADSHVVVFGQQEVSLKVFIQTNPPSEFRTSIIRNNATNMDGGVSQENIDWDLSSVSLSDYNTWVTLKQIVTFPDPNIDPLQDFADARFQIRIDEANLTAALQCVMFFDDIKFTPSITSAQDGNWEDTTTWVGSVVPTAASPTVIAHTVTINDDEECSSMLINNTPATFISVNPGKSLTINGDVTTSNDIFLLSSSTTFSSLIVKGTINGQIAYQRFVAAEGTRDLISVPVTGLTFGSFANAGANSQLVVSSTTPAKRLFGPFDNSTGSYVDYLVESIPMANDNNHPTLLVPGKGYRAATNAGSTLRFKSTATTSDVSIALTDETATGTGNYKRWNLIGNPYPSYLDFGAFFTENSSEFDPDGAYQAIYGYTGNGWTTWNNLNASDKLAPGQGFFVKAKSGGSTTDVIFKPAMRTIGSSNDFLVGRSSTPNNVLSEFFLSSESDTHTTKVYFVENQTRGLDPGYDAGAFGGSGAGIYTHLIENNTGINFAIQALPYQDFNDVVVPVGVKVNTGVQATIGLDNATSNISSNINVYLEDNVTNIWTLLNTSDYSFTPSTTLNGTGRFYIHYSNAVLSIDNNTFDSLNIYTEQSSKQVIVKGQLNADTSATIYDIQGRAVLTKELNQNSTTNTIDANNLSTGIYIVKLQNTTGSRSQKVILK